MVTVERLCSPWNEETCRNATVKGNLEVLNKSARACGCPWNIETAVRNESSLELRV